MKVFIHKRKNRRATGPGRVRASSLGPCLNWFFFAKWERPWGAWDHFSTTPMCAVGRRGLWDRPRTPQDAFQEPFKKWSGFDVTSASSFERLGSVLEGQDGFKTKPKSIKIGFPRLSVSASVLASFFNRF